MAKTIMSKVKASETEQSKESRRLARKSCCRGGLEEMTAGVVVRQLARRLREVIPRQDDEQQFTVKPVMDLAKLGTPPN